MIRVENNIFHGYLCLGRVEGMGVFYEKSVSYFFWKKKYVDGIVRLK